MYAPGYVENILEKLHFLYSDGTFKASEILLMLAWYNLESKATL
jgi:hypothetical protein